MKRWASTEQCGAALKALGLALIGAILAVLVSYDERIDQFHDTIQELAQRAGALIMQEDSATTPVPCPNQGVTHTVCTVQKENETHAAFVARHKARVQAFIDACGE